MQIAIQNYDKRRLTKSSKINIITSDQVQTLAGLSSLLPIQRPCYGVAQDFSSRA